MKTYKSNLPEISLKLKKGETLNVQIKCSNDIANVLRQIWDNDSLPIYESVICIFLNRQNRTLGWLKVSQGGISGTVCDVRLILSTALNCLASGIILAHNHPSGNLQPSEQDNKLVKKLNDGASIIDMKLLDSIILTEDSYYSYADNSNIL